MRSEPLHPDSDNHVSDIATVVRWVLFMTQSNEENGGGTTFEERHVRAATTRLDRLFDSIEKRSRHHSKDH